MPPRGASAILPRIRALLSTVLFSLGLAAGSPAQVTVGFRVDGDWGHLFKGNTAPLLLGEFGTKLATDRDRQWLDKLTDYIDGDFDLDGHNELPVGQQGISWTFWCFNPNSGDTGGILNDDWTTVNQAKLAYLTNSMAPPFGVSPGHETRPLEGHSP